MADKLGGSRKKKGYVSCRKCKDALEKENYLTDTVEKHGKFIIHKDLFSSFSPHFGFDIIGINHGKVRFIQVKTNNKANDEPYERFAKLNAHDNCTIEQWVWQKKNTKKKSGFIIYNYTVSGTIKTDFRLDKKTKKKKVKKNGLEKMRDL